MRTARPSARRLRFHTRAGFVIAALLLSAAGWPQAGADSATRLLEASGFDAILRFDARRDGTLIEQVPESAPPELRAAINGVFEQTLRYAEMRRANAAAISTRLDAAAIDPHLRWWSSSAGQAVSAAQVAAFRELASSEQFPPRAPNPAAQPVMRESPFARLLPGLEGTSRGAHECMALFVSFRRECTDLQAVPELRANAADTLLSRYATLSDGDLAAYRAYLKTAGAQQVVEVLADVYRQTRLGRFARAQTSIADATRRFARGKIGNDSEATLAKVIALVDEDRSLEEARMILHLLRSVAPRDPRIPVELARVAIKQGPLVARADIPGSPPVVEPEFLADAQGWMDRAIALDPKRADTLVLAGHLAYLQNQFAQSIAFLEQARQIGTTNPWLRLNLADALWALGRSKGVDRGLLNRAAQELEAALSRGLPRRMEWQANHSLAHIYADLNAIAKARVHFQRVIASSIGYDKAALWSDYASFLLFTAGDPDAAIAAAREATKSREFDVGHSALGQALLVKAGKLYAGGLRNDASRLVQEAQRELPGLEQNYSSLARMPPTFPGVFALLESRAIDNLANSEGGRTLLNASRHAGASEIERLIKWRADPNYQDPFEGTPLIAAIQAGNLPALRMLLDRGADASIRDPAGRLPLELAEEIHASTDAKGAEILAALRSAARRKPAASPAGAPLRAGYIYRALKPISGDRYGHEVVVGAQITFAGYCRYLDENIACLQFRNPASKDSMMDVALEKSQLASWRNWFEEIGPAPASTH